MTTRTYKLTVTTEVQPLCAADPKRKEIQVFNLGGGTVCILSAQNQTWNDGYPVYETVPFKSNECKDRLWIVKDESSSDVRVMIVSE